MIHWTESILHDSCRRRCSSPHYGTWEGLMVACIEAIRPRGEGSIDGHGRSGAFPIFTSITWMICDPYWSLSCLNAQLVQMPLEFFLTGDLKFLLDWCGVHSKLHFCLFCDVHRDARNKCFKLVETQAGDTIKSLATGENTSLCIPMAYKLCLQSRI